MMVSIQPKPPHLVPPMGPSATEHPDSLESPASAIQSPGASGATSDSAASTWTVTPEMLSMIGMPALSAIDIVPPPLDISVIHSHVVADHLRAARLRLLPDLPNSFQGYTVSNSMWSWWCRSCGALPDTWTRTEKGKATGSGSRTPSKRKKRKISSPKRPPGTSADSDGDMFETELQRTLESLASGESQPAPPARKPPSPPNRRRKPSKCSICGEPNAPMRSWMTIDLPPARTVARTRAATGAATSDAPAATPVGESAAPTPTPAVLQVNTPDTSSTSTPATSVPPSPSLNFWNTPSMQHIATSPGDLPTYPFPPVIPPPSPSGASPQIKIPPGGGQPPPAKKRKSKKSGLAKLLAQNAQREAENSSGSGNWGLG